jgi:uncharacterized coiled-coil protein SlyX
MDETSLNERINKLEWTVEKQTEDLDKLDNTTSHLKKTLYGIEKTLTQIRWFAMGFIALYIADQFGLTKVLQLLS